MPKDSKIKKILLLGSGAIKIGEAGEFDYSGAQAIKALREEGIEVILVNPNVATIQTDKKFVGEKAYFLPVSLEFVEKVIEKERPDGILLGFGGQTALNCGTELAEKGVYEKYGVKVLGTSVEAIERADNRDIFRKTMIEAGIPVLPSKKANSVEEALEAAREIGYPVMVRVAYTLGGQGTGVAYNDEQLKEIVSVGLAHSRISQVLIEKYVGKWKEIEYEVLRDNEDNCMIVCSMENFDPMGIHTGDSIVVAPSQTVSDDIYQKLKATSFAVLRALGLIGECNIQLAVNYETNEFYVIEVNSRLSRSSALASKASGYPIAYVTAKIAIGYNLPEIVNKKTGGPAAFLEPEIDYVVVKMPRWDFQKFRNVNRKLGTQMKSVGEVMAIGKTFEEAIQKAVRMTDIGKELTDDEDVPDDIEEIKRELEAPTDKRIFYIVKALRLGLSVNEIHKLTGIAEVFLEGIKRIVDFENVLKSCELNEEILKKAKCLGFSDKKIAELTGKKWEEIRKLRKEFGIIPRVKMIKTARRWSENANYLYMTYNAENDDIEFEKKKKIIVLGSGCYRIGSSVEFDWCCVNMAWALKERGFENIMINCNPETVSTDFDVMDKLYFEELTLERVLDIYEKENPEGIVVSVGGQTPNNLALKLAKNGVKIIGTSAEDIDRAEDRAKFSKLLDELGIKQPKWGKVEDLERAKELAERIGYPVLIRPSYVLSGSAMNVALNESQLKEYLTKAAKVSREHPVVISKFMVNAREVEVDCVSDGENVLIGAIIEHLENAGVHSGDAIMSIPTLTINEAIKDKIRDYTRKIAKSLRIKGPFNIQYLVKDGEVYVIECNLRASRSMPFVSKTIGINLMQVAADAILGKKIKDGEYLPNVFGVKVPQFSFMRLEGVDPVTGVEMVSTGEVAAFGKTFDEAFVKALIASGMELPKNGDGVLISIGKEKSKIIDIANKLVAKNMKIYATEKTSEELKKYGIENEMVRKISEPRPNILDYLMNKKIKMVINIPFSNGVIETQVLDDEYQIRRKSVEFKAHVVSNLQAAKAITDALDFYHKNGIENYVEFAE